MDREVPLRKDEPPIGQSRTADSGSPLEDERFRILLETLPFMAFFIGPDGRARHYNQRFIEYHGVIPGPTPDARTGLLHPDDQGRLRAARGKAAATGSEYVVEARLRRHDGVYRWHRIHNKPIELQGRPVSWLGTAVDVDDVRRSQEVLEERVAERTLELEAVNRMLREQVAERERAEAILLESEQRYRMLYDRTPMALQSVDSGMRLIAVNQFWLELLGYELNEVLGRAPTEFMTVDSARLYRERSWPEMLRSHGQAVAVEYRFIKRSGEEFDGRLVARGEFDSGRRFVRSWSVIADVTAQRRAEARLRQMQKIEALGQLTSGVAHDFNNLLTIITGNLEMLASRVGEDDAKSKRLLLTAREAARRGGQLTGQLLAFARRQRLTTRAVDINEIVRDIEGLLQSTIGGSLRVETRLDADVWPALADPTQLELVILNLAINARDAMPLGGTITITTGNARIGPPRRGTEPPAGEYATITVADTGTGMTPDILDRVFEPFFTTKNDGKGSGLGLAQVLGVMQQIGGGIRIDTAPGRGTRVQILLARASTAHGSG
jgi:PAS domain S-box-containing protein